MLSLAMTIACSAGATSDDGCRLALGETAPYALSRPGDFDLIRRRMGEFAAAVDRQPGWSRVRMDFAYGRYNPLPFLVLEQRGARVKGVAASVDRDALIEFEGTVTDFIDLLDQLTVEQIRRWTPTHGFHTFGGDLRPQALVVRTDDGQTHQIPILDGAAVFERVGSGG